MTEKNQVHENGKDFPDFHVSGQQVKVSYFHRWDNLNNLPKITEVGSDSMTCHRTVHIGQPPK